MKPEEAIKKLKYMKICYEEEIGQCSGLGDEEWTEHIDMCNVAIQALEKQVAKKPRYYIDNWDHSRPGCPGCPRNEILYAGQKYCSVCGTKIDWSVEE